MLSSSSKVKNESNATKIDVDSKELPLTRILSSTLYCLIKAAEEAKLQVDQQKTAETTKGNIQADRLNLALAKAENFVKNLDATVDLHKSLLITLKKEQIVTGFHKDYNPLFLAIKNHFNDLAKLLLQQGASVKRQDSNGGSVLHHAIENGNSQFVEDLLEHSPSDFKAILDLESRILLLVETALARAIRFENEKIINLLLDQNAKLSTGTFDTLRSALMCGLGPHTPALVEKLIAKGAQYTRNLFNNFLMINSMDMTPTVINIARQLLKLPINKEELNGYFSNIIKVKYVKTHTEIISLLKENGATVAQEEIDAEFVEAAKNNDEAALLELAKLKSENLYDVFTTPGTDGLLAIHHALKIKNIDLVNNLLRTAPYSQLHYKSQNVDKQKEINNLLYSEDKEINMLIQAKLNDADFVDYKICMDKSAVFERPLLEVCNSKIIDALNQFNPDDLSSYCSLVDAVKEASPTSRKTNIMMFATKGNFDVYEGVLKGILHSIGDSNEDAVEKLKILHKNYITWVGKENNLNEVNLTNNLNRKMSSKPN